MQNRTQEKNRKARSLVRVPPRAHRGIDVTPEKLIHWLVPRPPVHPQPLTIPPRFVKTPIPKPCDFRQGVEEGLE